MEPQAEHQNDSKHITRLYVIVGALAIALFLWVNIVWHPWSTTAVSAPLVATQPAPAVAAQPAAAVTPPVAHWDD